MPRTHKENGKFTSYGAKQFGFQKGNKLGKKFQKGEKHWNWGGGYKYYKSGSGRQTYRRVKVGDKWIAEHRSVMEKHLGRKLTRKEVIHHKDGDGLNNDISNLELMVKGKHDKIHLKRWYQRGNGGGVV